MFAAIFESEKFEQGKLFWANVIHDPQFPPRGSILKNEYEAPKDDKRRQKMIQDVQE